MSKNKSVFCCNSCGYETAKWLGKCPSCSEWNTFKEISLGKKKSSVSVYSPMLNNKPEKITEVQSNEHSRSFSGISEWDRVLGGTVAGQAILISGEPGIGKSTLLIQIAHQLSQNGTVLYINGEESSGQVKLRAERLGITSENLYLFSETEESQIINAIKEQNPTFIIVDSLQTLSTNDLDSSPGSLPQLRECTHRIVHYCKANNITSLLVSHVTKDGSIAGPKAIEHLVDTVLFLESDTRGIYRVLRSFKNRFGTTEEAGFFEMKSAGLIPAIDLSEAFLSLHDTPVSGSSIYAHSEGQRIFPVELQALCHHSAQNYPRRMAEGLDNNRLALITAVIEKQLKIPMSKFDIYANITGGLEIKDRSLDLALVVALCSSFKETPLPSSSAFFGEVGLSGEIRPVRDAERRIKECDRLGIQSVYLPYQKSKLDLPKDFPKTKLKFIRHINEIFVLLFK